MGEPGKGPAAARHERLLLRLLTLSRVVLLIQAGLALSFLSGTIAYPAAFAGLLGVLVADNVVLIAFYMRRGALAEHWLAALDVCLGMAALVAALVLLKLTAKPDPIIDNVLYPYTVGAVSVIGLAYRRLIAPVIAAAFSSAVYIVATAWLYRSVSYMTLLANASTYSAWAVASWLLSGWFRRLSAELDEARRTTVARERELAQERERTRLSRVLHDQILQTIEFLGRDTWIADPRIRDHVAADAVWLRQLVSGELPRPAEGLAAALDEVVARQTRAGMRIEMNTSGLRDEAIPGEAVQVVAGAVSELLTNVRKHAGTTRAVLRAVSDAGKVTVTVLDQGCGFVPADVSAGLGLRQSVIARVREVGGNVVVSSAPDLGTHVEITIPLPTVREPGSKVPGTER